MYCGNNHSNMHNAYCYLPACASTNNLSCNTMRNAYKYYKTFNNPIAIVIQVALFIAITIFLVSSTPSNADHVGPLLLLAFWYFLSELTIHFKINKQSPERTIEEAGSDHEKAAVFSLRKLYESSNTTEMIKKIRKNKEIRFVLKKIGDKNVTFSDTSKKETIKSAALLSAESGGKYIFELDIFAAYLMQSENNTKYLEKNNLLPDDVKHIHLWARNHFDIEKERNSDLNLKGSGAFDFFVFGWTAELKKYAYDFTAYALRKKTPPSVIGREEEYDKLLTILSKKSSNNAILVADPGAGKKTLISRFAYDAYTHSGAQSIKTFALLTDKILSGANTQGEREQRLELLFTDISHAGNVVVLVENIESLFGGGGYNFDISGTLYDFLESSPVQMIGTTTEAQYEKVIKQHKTAAQLFETIRLQPPDEQTAFKMIINKVSQIEREYSVVIQYDALKAAIANASTYTQTEVGPGNIVHLLENAASTAQRSKNKILDKEVIEETIKSKTHIVLGEPTKEEKEKLLNLEKLIHQTVINQNAGVHAVASALKRTRSGFKEKHKPIASFLFLGPTGVGKTQTAKALARNYFENEESMIRLDMSEYSTPLDTKKLLGELPNQPKDKSLIHTVNTQPFSLILLDEFEKAHAQVHNLFLQVFDEARISNNQGETADFSNTIIIATSNAGSEQIRETISQAQNETYKKQIVNTLLTSKIFTPELVNRFTEVVMFTPLSKTHASQIAQIRTEEMLKKLKEKNMYITADSKAVNKIATEGYSQEFGARNIKRYIEQNVEELISNAILENVIQKGSKATLSLDQSGNFVIVLNT